MADRDKITSGRARVTYGGVDLGYTVGPVVMHVESRVREVVGERHGLTATDVVHTGERWSVRCRLAEWGYANLTLVHPMGFPVAGGLYLGYSPGRRYAQTAQLLRIHPVRNGQDTSGDLVIWRAVVISRGPVEFSDRDDRAFEVEFLALVDSTRAEGQRLGWIASGS